MANPKLASRVCQSRATWEGDKIRCSVDGQESNRHPPQPSSVHWRRNTPPILHQPLCWHSPCALATGLGCGPSAFRTAWTGHALSWQYHVVTPGRMGWQLKLSHWKTLRKQQQWSEKSIVETSYLHGHIVGRRARQPPRFGSPILAIFGPGAFRSVSATSGPSVVRSVS